MTKLSTMKPGEQGRIARLEAAPPLRRRLMDMGVLPGQEIRVEKVAPLGDPIEVTVRGYLLSLRKHEADGIAVEANS